MGKAEAGAEQGTQSPGRNKQSIMQRKSLFGNADLVPSPVATEQEVEESAESSSMEIMKQILESSSFKRLRSGREDKSTEDTFRGPSRTNCQENPERSMRTLRRTESRALDLDIASTEVKASPKSSRKPSSSKEQPTAPYEKFLTKIQSIRETVTSKEKQRNTVTKSKNPKQATTRLMPIIKVTPPSVINLQTTLNSTFLHHA